MRRSCAPSMRNNALIPRIKTENSRNDDNKVSSSSDVCFGSNLAKAPPLTGAWGNGEGYDAKPSNDLGTGKIMFNVVWRDITNKKHKTWKGDGTLEFIANAKKAVLKDEAGKYMGSTTIVKVTELEEGVQLLVGGKEIELQEQVKDIRQVFAQRKLAVSSNWGAEEWQPKEPEAKKPKGHFVFQPNLALPVLKAESIKRTCTRAEQPSTSAVGSDVHPLILPTPADTPVYKYNKLDRPVHEMRVAGSLTSVLRPHQREGVRFIYDCVMGFQQPHRYGVILADEMGLGKTLQCLAVAHTLLRQGPYGGERVLQRVLIMTPSSLVATWNNEVNKWLCSERMFAFVVNGKHKLQQYARQQHIPFVIVSYETFLAHSDDFQQLDFDMLICDEGHRLKNNETKICSALRSLNVEKRILLTGTPVQNDLQEFFTLADFVNPGIFGTYAEFRKYYELPIVQSQCPDADAEVLQLGAERSAELNQESAKFLLRRSQDINRKYLPKKREYVIFVRPSELQQLMFQKVLQLYEQRKETILKDLSPLQIITILKKICNHPSLVAHTKAPNLLTRNLERYVTDWSEMGVFDSSKFDLVHNFLICTALQAREKVVIVSNHTKTLNMLQGLCDYLSLKCLRLDGSTPTADRSSMVRSFNTNSGADAELVFLISAKAGGMGLNLCGASRLILFDNDWNPATDAQAMSRIWRDGQQRDVHIYRLVTAGTIEEKIFQRQVAKMSLGGCLLGTEENLKFSADELADIFSVQVDYSKCQTHELLKCDCNNDGKNGQLTDVGSGKQINEIMDWEHHGQPFHGAFLESAHLIDTSENIMYIFSHQTQLN